MTAYISKVGLTMGVKRTALLSTLWVIRVRESLRWKRASLAVGASASFTAGPLGSWALGISCLFTCNLATDRRRERKALRLGWCISGSSLCVVDFVSITVFDEVTMLLDSKVFFIIGDRFTGLAWLLLLLASLFSSLPLKAFTPLAGDDARAAFSLCITLLSLLTRKFVDGGGFATLRRLLRSSRMFVPLSIRSIGFSTLVANRTPPSLTSQALPGEAEEKALLWTRPSATSCSRSSRFSFKVWSNALICRRSDKSRVDSSCKGTIEFREYLRTAMASHRYCSENNSSFDWT